MAGEIDYRKCEDGQRHEWAYLGRKAQAYVCLSCELKVTKNALKEATDA